MMVFCLGVGVAVAFAAMALLHIYWAAGGRRGRAVAVPVARGGRLFNPSALGTLAVAAALFSAMLIILGRLGVWAAPLPGWVFDWGTWGVALAFLARAVGDFRYVGFFKRVRGTAFARWDTRLFSPLCLFISLSAIAVALGGATPAGI